MGTYLLRRLLLMIPTLIGITFLVFMIVAMAPGGIGATLKAQGGSMQSQSNVALQQAYLEDRYGLDDPAPVQYVRWLSRISPIRFGARDLVTDTGEIISLPKPVKTPPLWNWFTASLPTASVAASDEPTTTDSFNDARRAYADARSEYIAATTRLREAMASYAKDRNIPHGVDSKDLGVERVIARTQIDRTSPTWIAFEATGVQAINAYQKAINARESLVRAFRANPYPRAGIGLIPGALSLAAPDFGVAYSQGTPVISLMTRALPVTLLLNLIAFPIIYLIAIPGGMLAAARRGSVVDVGLGLVFLAFWSFPVVLAGVLSIGFLASNQYLGLFPVSGLHSLDANAMRFLPGTDHTGVWTKGWLVDLLWHVCLPVVCLVYPGFAILSKQTRAAMLDNYSADYVRTAKAKGVAPRDVILRHVFRNSLLPLITMFVSIFPAMLSGSVVIERIFTVPGMGSLILQSIQDRDRELLLANTMMIAGVNLVALLIADVLYALADPRVAYE